MTSLERLSEHINRCLSALENVGADGLNQLQMHLRLAIEWAMNLECEARRESLGERFTGIANKVISLNHTPVVSLPEELRAIAARLKNI
jgi:hypothetical protein